MGKNVPILAGWAASSSGLLAACHLPLRVLFPAADTLMSLAIKIEAMPGYQAIGPEHPKADDMARVWPSRARFLLGRARCLVKRELEADRAWVRMGGWELELGVRGQD